MALQPLRNGGVEGAASLGEGAVAIGIEHLCPEVDVVARGVAAAREQMLEMHQPVVQPHAAGQALGGEQLALIGAGVGRRLGIGERMHRQIGDRAGGVAHRLIALVEALRPAHPLDQVVRHRRTGLPVTGVAAQHLGLGDPVFEDLRGQLDEIAQHLGARQALVAHARQQAMQTMAELMEKRSRVVQ